MNIEAYFKVTYGLYIISSATDTKRNGYVSNTVFQVTAEPPQFAIACSKNNLTTSIIEQSRVFAISVLEKETSAEVIGIFGYKSGNEIDKFSNVRFKTGITGAPILLDNAIAYFECEVVQVLDVGSHLLFIGKVMDDELLSADAEPLTYAWYREVRKGKAPKNAPTYIDPEKLKKQNSFPGATEYYCTACGYIYNPEEGDPKARIAPGTPFADLPDTWDCPVCGAEKSDFAEREIITSTLK
jgi:flavin reductase (DIM6/NTAB) family NADH-FMN oxidoreductase RutF/rubredoxin